MQFERNLAARKRLSILIIKSFNLYDFLLVSGVFQLKQARGYCEEHCSTTNLDNNADFPIQICNSDSKLIRIQFKSRHSNSKKYYTYIHYSSKNIRNSCCDCPIGDRQVGVCSHRAAAIWFLAYQRYSSGPSSYQPSSSYLSLLDDSEHVDDYVDSSDDDDDFRYSLL